MLIPLSELMFFSIFSSDFIFFFLFLAIRVSVLEGHVDSLANTVFLIFKLLKLKR